MGWILLAHGFTLLRRGEWPGEYTDRVEDDAYRALAAREGAHWFHRGRRALVEHVLGEPQPVDGRRVLEIGSGTGGNVDLLAGFGELTLIEPNAMARSLTTSRRVDAVDLRAGYWPGQEILGPGEVFHLIALFDVLEHLDDDVGALRAVRAHLAPDARVIITVPAYSWMWSPHDERLHHRRRYRKSSLVEAIAAADLQVRYCSYFNTVLFPFAMTARLLTRLTSSSDSPGHDVPSERLNSLMLRAMLLERHVIPRRSLPYGLSLMAIATDG